MPTINLGAVAKLADVDAPADISDAAVAADSNAPKMVLLLYSATAGLTSSVTSRSCTHEGCDILTGGIWGHSDFPLFNPATRIITCPCHGSRFNLVDGAVVRGPATDPLPLFSSRIVDDELLVDY